MSLDTTYRPRIYDDVLGQEGTIRVLRQFVHTGKGAHQSYLFAGPYGSGKTTLGRILARALLCESPVDGNPCDKCQSCKSILEEGSSENLTEVDAATNSGKDSMRKIVEELQYSTFSGKRRIYIFDESHQLSKDALDSILKPMEDCAPGSEDKILVCIFCTTEPGKMRATVLSRCAPGFVVQPATPDQIGGLLSRVCDKEGIPYEKEVLPLIAEVLECHVRDCLKAIEGISLLGPVNRDTMVSYLNLDAGKDILACLRAIGKDKSVFLTKITELLNRMSPATLYERAIGLCMLSYRLSLGVGKPPVFVDAGELKTLAEEKGDWLLTFVEKFSNRPTRPTSSMLLCDFAQLHVDMTTPKTVQVVQVTGTITQDSDSEPSSTGSVSEDAKPRVEDGVFINPNAVNKTQREASTAPKPVKLLDSMAFFRLVRERVGELKGASGSDGQSGRDNVGGT